MNIFTNITSFNADVHTPVELYMSLRNHYRKTCLLESNDYHSRSDSKSFIGLDPIVEIKLENNKIIITGEIRNEIIKLNTNESASVQIQAVFDSFKFTESSPSYNGFFGRIGFEFSLLSESHIEKVDSTIGLPDVHFFLFKNIIVIDHFRDNGSIISNSLSEEKSDSVLIDSLLSKRPFTDLPFEIIGEEKSDFTDAEFKALVEKTQGHCLRGDVFQLVVSNAFSQGFFGDDFQVYRQLRRLNPSPYLFYFDFEEYRLFGSSPEAQLIISDGKAEIHPIAGTVPKTGDNLIDDERIRFLVNDEKENAEHTMLVDLARNDLSKDCSEVKVETYKEVQHFSHVIHLVSKVTGKLRKVSPFPVLNSSFPAGTLSGTPKPKALELISKYERSTRDFYGGAIGIIGSKGNLNMAIVIRSLLSKNNVLHYRAGAGVVLNSISESETQEVHHKLRAVRTAISVANVGTVGSVGTVVPVGSVGIGHALSQHPQHPNNPNPSPTQK